MYIKDSSISVISNLANKEVSQKNGIFVLDEKKVLIDKFSKISFSKILLTLYYLSKEFVKNIFFKPNDETIKNNQTEENMLNLVNDY